MRNWLVAASATLVLTACGGGSDGGAGGNDRNALAAQACKVAAESRLGGKIYELDLQALGASMKPAPNGEHFLTAPITIEPGLTSEAKQIVECTVRFSDAKPQPDVVGFVFNW
ncbi:hypothetical protein [Arenimonas donghaensis]|uniref:Lipoprotein n=1 Tax=Arenimonas donghaensis DSM 18148 = HO3-R19 TaxID=1121014 RepID=A0A087MJ28_9GAMM|nr:hypothetical protein [Arenimonas donghaensis]KFL36881.1 hypothetical protein N788_12195 [Arenimonas donghaensis DSM 18148 = HO3-R19]